MRRAEPSLKQKNRPMRKLIFTSILIFGLVTLSSFVFGLKSIKLALNWDGDLKKNDFLIIDQKQKKTLKDGTQLQYFDFTFFKDSKKLQTIPVIINGFEKESDWDAESPFEIDSINKNNSLVLVHNGFPACGYGQNYLLFSKNKANKVELLDQYETFFDAPYGTYQIYKKINATSFARIALTIGGSDEETKEGEDEIAIVSKSDSVVFYQDKDRWVKKQITPKEKVYWQREMKLDEAYNTDF